MIIIRVERVRSGYLVVGEGGITVYLPLQLMYEWTIEPVNKQFGAVLEKHCR